MLNVGKIAVFGHIDRRMRPVPCIVCTVVAVEAVIARILKILCGALGFLHVTPHLGVILARESALTEALGLGYDAVSERYREIVAAGGFYRLYDLDREAVSVFKRSAVFVGTLVDVFQRELIEQIALVHRMNLNAVNARVLQHFCAFCERFNELADLVNGHGARRHLV